MKLLNSAYSKMPADVARVRQRCSHTAPLLGFHPMTHFHLNPESRKILLSRVPVGSTAHAALRRATRIGDGSFLVVCELADAELLRGIAKEHCREAETGIAMAITIALRKQPKQRRSRREQAATNQPVQLTLKLD
ncbi:MAG: hypothetical protein ACREQP_08890 [Candidatus Binatia bacterium]